MSDEFAVEERVVERPFFWEEEPVLSCSLRLPSLTGGGTAARRINRYYQQLEARLIRRWERRLYPAACAEAQEARQASYPFLPHEARVTFQVTCLRDGRLSLYWDDWLFTGGAHGAVCRHGDTWDTHTGCPMPMAAFFPPGTKLRKALSRLAVQQAQANLDAGTSLYFDDFQSLIFRRFDRENFYLADGKLMFFYPLYAIAPYAEGIPTFTAALAGDSGTDEETE